MTIEYRVASRLVCFVRSAGMFDDVPSLRLEIAAWARAVEGLDELRELALLLDWRLALLITDPAILSEVVSRTDAIGRQFARQALLLATPLGALQSSRLSRIHDSAPVVFTDEAAAMAYAMSR